jgi:aminopeptidase N
MLTPERSCYDVRFYHLDVRIDPATRSLSGSNTIYFTVVFPSLTLQLDLFSNLIIHRITLDEGSEPLACRRDSNTVYVLLPGPLPAGTTHALRVDYGGEPIVARNPPWQGGFTWENDAGGEPWVVVTCQGTGASLWWPVKDHQSDEPDSMLISVTVPPGLENISNGRLRTRVQLPSGWTRFDWFVSAPINTYNVTVNIGRYVHFREYYVDRETLTLDYYVFPENLERSRKHFAQVRTMMQCYEKAFGPYPFYADGYKLVECPHTGMEHQSAVAYGNRYLGGYRGRASSAVGLSFDFIIMHESAHEWWGNSLTAFDVADMWIHESFAAYAEALYVECTAGREQALTYINAKRPNVRNDRPMIGTPNVDNPGSGDMYDKGQLVLNTLRSVLDNDSLWFELLRGLQRRFRYATATAEDILAFTNSTTGRDLRFFFDQYFRTTRLPVLEVLLTRQGERTTAHYRWKADVTDFRMPVKATDARGEMVLIYPTTTWQTMSLGTLDPSAFRVADELFYIETSIRRTYLDPALPPERRRSE